MSKIGVLIPAFLILTLPAITESQSIVPRSTTYSQADDQSIDNEDTVQSYFNKGKSYECSIQILDFAPTDEFYIFKPQAVDPDGQTITPFFIGNVYPAVAPIDGLTATQHSRTRISITANKSGIYKFFVEDVFNRNGTEPSTILCGETTLYGGFNRFFASVVIVEVNNASDQDIGILLTVTNSRKQVIIDSRPSVALGNTSTDVIFADLPPSELGQITVNHNSPIGALSGTVAEYDFNSNGSIVLKRATASKRAASIEG